MPLQSGHFMLARVRNMPLASMLMVVGLALSADKIRPPTPIGPKQIIFGVLSACAIMLLVFLLCVLVAYLSMAAMYSF